MTTRIYHVEMYRSDDTGPIDHLVEAKSAAAAASYIIRRYGKVQLAAQKVIAHLCTQGCSVETAADEPAPQAD